MQLKIKNTFPCQTNLCDKNLKYVKQNILEVKTPSVIASLSLLLFICLVTIMINILIHIVLIFLFILTSLMPTNQNIQSLPCSVHHIPSQRTFFFFHLFLISLVQDQHAELV